MTIDEIRETINDLEIQLHHAVATMELNNQIQFIRNRIKDIQNTCPHKEYNFDYRLSSKCPICRKKFEENNK